MTTPTPAPPTDTRLAGRAALEAYLAGTWSLDELVDWASRLEALAPTDPWVRRVAERLADPLLCRERATAFARDLLDGA